MPILRTCLFMAGLSFLLLSVSCKTAVAQQAVLPPALDVVDSEETPDDLGDLDDLLDADLNQLAATDVVVPMFSEEVTTVARQEGTVARSPAAVFVITNEMIRRSGVRSIPEALRLAPGVQVAKIDSSKWAISIRGFSQRFANKLLVQIDGRTVYTPLFAGIWWDVQDVLLEDVARIEVIRGPGATVWGANAVNGVINVITKSAEDTQGVFAEVGGGREREYVSGRIGGAIEGGGGWRVYGKGFDRGAGYSPTGQASDDWHAGRVGFRADWKLNSSDIITAQGDYYDGDTGQRERLPVSGAPFGIVTDTQQAVGGGNALLRWTRTLDEESDFSFQTYFDRTDRTFGDTGWHEQRDTIDFDFQHRFPLAERHSVIWGVGYRNTSDKITDSFQLRYDPSHRSDDRFGFFLQDEITLRENLWYLTLGSKFSHNDYTQFEIQPTARLLFTPTDRQSFWGAISRAVRSPSRSSDDITALGYVGPFPTYTSLNGNTDYESENLLAMELGWRAAPTNNFTWDLATFYNLYSDLQQRVVSAPYFDAELGATVLPIGLRNGLRADSWGFELAATMNVADDFTLHGGYSFLRLHASGGTVGSQGPRNQLFLHSSQDLSDCVQFDLIGRYTDALASPRVPSYFELDTRLAWQPTESTEIALVGRNLLNGAHPEFGDDAILGTLATQVKRELYASFTWRY
ncbi:TonB-dependent receptor plug domain-containing protein [Fuerstiella marisgermanici]|uniref:Colicin I receptor n=1 Tax=Fuerstiella marisgermanici TaxID=1891926 RepID=A0A1P8WB53_9PLAN|nr:TonB-dependent receptor [Fuerstiella marisgermanici]APZ91271.1 Colicin I receptor precursor [Fuerstiella marisgermanici]